MYGQKADREVRVREIAYRMWEEEGHPDGAAERHWRAAEAMIEADDPARKAIEGEPPGDMEKPPEMISDPARKRRAAAAARSA